MGPKDLSVKSSATVGLRDRLNFCLRVVNKLRSFGVANGATPQDDSVWIV